MATNLSQVNIVLNANSAEYVRKLATTQARTKEYTGKMRKDFQNLDKSTAKSSSGMVRNLGQVSYQLQDVAVQAQLGTSAFVILAQQGSQVASAFGPAGVIFGAFLAIGGAIASATLNMDEQSEALDQLLDGYKDLSKEQQAQVDRQVSSVLSDAYESETEAIIASRNATYELEAAQKRLDGTGQGLLDGFFVPTQKEMYELANAANDATADLQTVRDTIAGLIKQRNEATGQGTTYDFLTADSLGTGVTQESIDAENAMIAKERAEYEREQEQFRRKQQAAAAKHAAVLGNLQTQTQAAIAAANIASADGELNQLIARQDAELERIESSYDDKVKATEEYEELISAIKLKHHQQRNETQAQLDKEALDKHKADLTAAAQAEATIAESFASIHAGILGSFTNLLSNFTDESALAAGAVAGLQVYAALSQNQIETQKEIAGLRAAVYTDPTLVTVAAKEAAAATLTVKAQAASNIRAGLIVANQVAGQFHGGVDSLPSSLDNQSFLLKAGERVIQPEANKDLTKFLSNEKNMVPSQKSEPSNYTINAPMTVQGNVTDQKWFSEQLVKNRNTIAASVQKVEKERPNKSRR
ncbi:conserved hypothetical protein [Vibrio chagasii]|nr:conserved hypothetical protein [Vibrio chagasii]